MKQYSAVVFGALMAHLVFSVSVMAQGQPRAEASMVAAAGAEVAGKVRFSSVPHGVKVEVDISGLTPGEHGFHLHENGDCSAADFSSAGGHFNPRGESHGGLHGAQRHAGDFGNITADAQGRAVAEFVDHALAFDGAHSVISRSVIVHANRDDLTSQPAGNAGPRVGCGVVKALPQAAAGHLAKR